MPYCGAILIVPRLVPQARAGTVPAAVKKLKRETKNGQVYDGITDVRSWYGNRDDGNRSRAKRVLVGWL